MFKNYLKIAIRNLLSNKLYTFVNVFGIAVAMALCIVAYLNQSYNYMFDNFHQNADKIFRVKTVRLINGQEQKFGVVPRPLAPALAADFSGVEKSVRLTRSSAVVRIGENIFNETIMHADPFFFEMFDFPMKYGAHDGLRDKGKIILSEQMAQKYFGDENPVGKQIAVQYEDGKPRAFFVGAVAKKIPDHSSIHFDALAALDILADAGIDRPNNWADWSNAVFIQVADPAQLPTIAARMDGYIAAHNAVAPDWQIARFYFDPLRNLALNAWTENLRGDILKRAMHPAGMITPSIIAALLLLMACFNYINTAIAFSGKRLKEIGMRKVIGGTRGRLIVQFMGENFLLCALALILALGLAEIFVPVHDNMWPYFELTLDYSENMGLIAFLAGVLLLVGVVAGAYPAVYISAYHPVKILRGKQKFGGTSRLSRVLLTFQFAVSILTVIASLVFIRNADFLKNLDMGYDKHMVAVVPLPDAKYYEPYRNAIENNLNIVDVAGSRQHIARSIYTGTIESGALQSQASILEVGYDYLATMKLRFLYGRDFDENLPSDLDRSIIVSQKLIEEFGWQTPLGQTVTLDSVRYTIIGVVEDVLNFGPWRPVKPSVFRLIEPEGFRYLTARIGTENLAETQTFLRSEWLRLAPDVPYQGFFQDELMVEAVSVSDSIQKMFFYIALLAIAIAAMGLFALVSLNIARRTKEIGIRKVLGASSVQIMALVNNAFIRLLIIAALFASIAGYFTVQAMLASIYAYYVGFSATPFVLAILSILVIAMLTVGSQIIKAALANPVDALRYE